MADEIQTENGTLSKAEAQKFQALLASLGEEGAQMATIFGPAAMVVTNEMQHGSPQVTHKEQVAAAARLAYVIGESVDKTLTEQAIYDKVIAVEHSGGAAVEQDYVNAHRAGASEQQLADKQAAVIDRGMVEGMAQLGSDVLETTRKFYLTDIPPETYAAMNPTDMENADYIAAIKQYRQYQFEKAQVTPDEVIAAMKDRPVPRREQSEDRSRER